MALNIIFMGTPILVPILKSINESEHNILAVYTQRPKKKWGQKINISPIHEFSNRLNFKLDIQLNLIKNVIT